MKGVTAGSICLFRSTRCNHVGQRAERLVDVLRLFHSLTLCPSQRVRGYEQYQAIRLCARTLA